MIEPATVVYHPGGDGPPPVVKPGDFLLHHSSAFHSQLIRFGQGLRFHGKSRTFAYWNHASFVATPTKLIEAIGTGIVVSPLDKYAQSNFAIVRPDSWNDRDIAQAVRYAFQQVGAKYGFLTLVSCGLHMLTGGKLVIGLDGTQICSGLVARCLERGDTVFEHHAPATITPADLARHFTVPKPSAI
jgi:uncharacterized protein YycO